MPRSMTFCRVVESLFLCDRLQKTVESAKDVPLWGFVKTFYLPALASKFLILH